MVLQHIQKQYIRSLEGAPADGALLLNRFFDTNQDSLDRHNQFEAEDGQLDFLLVEIKSMLGWLAPEGQGKVSYYWSIECRQPYRTPGIIIITSSSDPHRVVLCLFEALFQGVKDGITIELGSEARPYQTLPPAFPSALQPYEMSISDLPEALQKVLDCIHYGSTDW